MSTNNTNNTNFNINILLNTLFFYNLVTIYNNEYMKKDNINVNNKELLKRCKLNKYSKCKEKSIFCSICCNNVQYNEYLRNLDCNYNYHKKCIDKWILCKIKRNETITCPMCRKTLIKN